MSRRDGPPGSGHRERMRSAGPDPTAVGALAEQLQAARSEIDHLRRRVARLERALAHYERIAVAVQTARFWDFSVYESIPDDEWVAIDREDCDRLLHALGFADRWRPWKTILERRHAD